MCVVLCDPVVLPSCFFGEIQSVVYQFTAVFIIIVTFTELRESTKSTFSHTLIFTTVFLPPTADDYRQNLRTLLSEVRLSYGAGLAMSLGGFARVELNYCVPLLVQRGDRPSHGLQFGVAASFL